MRTRHVWVVGLAALASACGSTVEQSAATGGLAGAGAGAVVGGPVGAVVGAGVGAAGGTGVEYGQRSGTFDRMEQKIAGSDDQAGRSSEDVRRAQIALRDQGFFTGPIDGIEGPLTRDALARYQERNGLQRTAQLDAATRDSLASQTAQMPPERRR
jgi:hypothetical protein